MTELSAAFSDLPRNEKARFLARIAHYETISARVTKLANWRDFGLFNLLKTAPGCS